MLGGTGGGKVLDPPTGAREPSMEHIEEFRRDQRAVGGFVVELGNYPCLGLRVELPSRERVRRWRRVGAVHMH